MTVIRKILFFPALALVFSGCFNPLSQSSREGIYPYDSTRDRAYILDQTEKWRFWLIADESHGYNQLTTLDTGLHCFNRLPVHFFMYYKDNRPVGFISYYLQEPYFGTIQFVFVDEGYRRQHVGERMIAYVISKMRQEGVLTVELCTRLINTGARRLYEKMGFKPLYDTGKYIYFEYICL